MKKKIISSLIAILIFILLHIYFTTDLVEKNNYKPILKHNFFPPFYCKTIGASPAAMKLIPNRDNFKKFKTFAMKNKKIYKEFMSFYSGDIPTILHNPPVDVFKLSFWEIFDIPCPDFNKLRIVSKSIAGVGDYQRLNGKPKSAAFTYLNILKFGFDCGNGFGAGNSLMTFMISIAIEKIAYRRLCVLFASGELDRDFEKKIISQITKIRKNRSSIYDAIKVEKYTWKAFDFNKHYCFDIFNLLSRYKKYNGKLKRGFLSRVFIYFFGSSATFYTHLFIDQFYELVEKTKQCKTFEQANVFLKIFKKKIMASSLDIANNKIWNPGKFMATNALTIVLPNYSYAISKSFAARNYFRALQLINKTNDFKRSRSSYPASLKQLDSEIIDIFNGKPMLYKRVNRSFILYSTGEDLKDDYDGIKLDGSKDQIFYDPSLSYFQL